MTALHYLTLAALVIFAYAVGIGLCKVGAKADRDIEKMMRRKEGETNNVVDS